MYFALKGALIFNLLSAPISDSGIATALTDTWHNLWKPVNDIFTLEANKLGDIKHFIVITRLRQGKVICIPYFMHKGKVIYINKA